MRRMYSENQIIKIVENVDLKPKSLEQLNYNWESGVLEINSEWLNGITASTPYCKVIVINKVLYVVLSAILSNSSESAISTANNKPIFLIDIPEEIAKKIYRKDGTTCDKPYNAFDDIASKVLYAPLQGARTMSNMNVLLYSPAPNKLGIYASDTRITVATGDLNRRFVDFRMFVVL